MVFFSTKPGSLSVSAEEGKVLPMSMFTKGFSSASRLGGQPLVYTSLPR